MRTWILTAGLGLATLGLGAGAGTESRAADPLLVAPEGTTWNLDDVGVYRVGHAYRGKAVEEFPVGWTGYYDERTGVALAGDGLRNGREAVILHPPWRGGTGVAFQEFHLRLPPARKIILKGATALREDGVGKSDGVRFRVVLDGRTLLDELRADADWKPFEFDLTGSAGEAVVLRFETDPGPKDDSSFDFGLWAGRSIVLSGYEPRPKRHPAPPTVAFRRLASREGEGAAPPAATAAKVEIRRDGDAFILRSTDDYGSLAFRWTPPPAPAARAEAEAEAEAEASNLTELGAFGSIVLEADRAGEAVKVPLATTARVRWTAPAVSRAIRWEEGDAPVLVREFEVGGQVVALRVKGSIVGRSLALDVTADHPVVEQIDGGTWGPSPQRRDIPTPYYSGGRIIYLPVEDLFTSSQVDWTISRASRIETTRAVYLALTDGARNAPAERFIYSAAWTIDEVLPNIPNPPSPHIKALSGRVVLDVWGGRYAYIARRLEALHDAGARDLAVIIHNWQRSGYDNALPAHFPAAEDKGGEAGMRELMTVGKRLGYLVVLHENYVDYYPNFEGFNEKDIARDSRGGRQLAWFHPTNKIQSFAVKPTVMVDLARTQSPEIHRRYETEGSFLDVNSAVPPWFHVDQQAGVDGAGTFQRVRRAHKETWEYLRATHGGPVFGEGNNHWYWSGLLDGVEAQFGSGWPSNAGLDAPLFVDFDLLKIHPLQLNHGMGYYQRWWDGSRVPSGSTPPMVVLDQYRAQEVAFGHAGFLSGSAWGSVPLVWLEYNLMAPLVSRTATAPVVRIDYQVDGKWMDASAVVRSGVPLAEAWNRVRVRFGDGPTVIVNQSAETMKAEGADLPRFGWIARGDDFTAGTTLRDGVIADVLDSPDAFFANARAAVDWDFSNIIRATPTARFRQIGPRRFAAMYAWRVREPARRDYRVFVHFGKAGAGDEEILFQQDHDPRIPASRWRAGTTVNDGPYEIRVPDGLPDGDYAWTIGLFAPDEGRAALEGPTDKSGRNLLGVVHVSNGGRTLRFTPEKIAKTDRAMMSLANLNRENKIIDFGPVRTDGGVSIRKEGGEWVAHVVPSDRAFSLELDTTRFGKPAEIQAEGGSASRVVPDFNGRWMRLRLNGAKSYRWPAE